METEVAPDKSASETLLSQVDSVEVEAATVQDEQNEQTEAAAVEEGVAKALMPAEVSEMEEVVVVEAMVMAVVAAVVREKVAAVGGARAAVGLGKVMVAEVAVATAAPSICHQRCE